MLIDSDTPRDIKEGDLWKNIFPLVGNMSDALSLLIESPCAYTQGFVLR